ncbi:MAG TPA: 5'-methylthioadenosine/adenosylhomocysteine nucleosidase [Ruminococcaceae bacterium]|nr:5'-methylthioadenosine/adenosylhomocysteine nucleosidase [Oscillospiraceae bacterium]
MIGIIGALEIEIEGFNALMEEKTEKRISGIPYVQGILAGKNCVTCICGVGKVNAAMSAAIMMNEFSPSLIVNTGVAGALKNGIGIGDLVIGTDVIQHDFDIVAAGNPSGAVEVGDELIIRFPCDNAATQILLDSAQHIIKEETIFSGTVATGDQFISGKEARHQLAAKFDALTCEMEGGAIAQVCYRIGVPFALLRSISDNIDKDDFIDFTVFAKSAAQKNIDVITEMLKTM